jgi:hypothetical protein
MSWVRVNVVLAMVALLGLASSTSDVGLALAWVGCVSGTLSVLCTLVNIARLVSGRARRWPVVGAVLFSTIAAVPWLPWYALDGGDLVRLSVNVWVDGKPRLERLRSVH